MPLWVVRQEGEFGVSIGGRARSGLWRGARFLSCVVAASALVGGIAAPPAIAATQPPSGTSSGNLTIVPASGQPASVVDNGNSGHGSVGNASYGFGLNAPRGTSASTTGAPASVASIVGIASSGANGYWEVATNGGVFSFNAPSYGSAGGQSLNAPMVGMAATPSGGGYWLVGADGGVFAYGNAGYYGSIPGIGGSGGSQTVAILPSLDGKGYREVTANGSVYDFGDAVYRGSLTGLGIKVNDVVSAARYGNGYCVLEANGWVHCWTSAGLVVATIVVPNVDIYTDPATSIAVDSTSNGFWVTTRTGAVYAYGTAAYEGGLSGTPYGPILGISGYGTSGYRLAGADGGIFDFNLPYEGNASTISELSASYAQQVGQTMLPEGNWGTTSEWTNGLYPLWNLESGWRWNVCYGGGLYPSCNYSGSAYGIPQANPGSKMCATGSAQPSCPGSAAYETNAWTQIMWGFWYIGQGSYDPLTGHPYGTPEAAWYYEEHGCTSPPCGYSPRHP